ncbi:MAG: transglutaminase family protein [Hyphomicrobium sp.]
MIVEIRHTTTYRYKGGARYSIQALRLTPPSFDGQRVIDWHIHGPGLPSPARFRDGFGNTVLLAATRGPHDETTIEASGLVETIDTNGLVRGLSDPAPLRVFLRETAKTRPDDAIRKLAGSVKEDNGLACLHALMQAVNEAVTYEVGSTDAHTSAAEALAEGKGVCQDHAHVFISAARSLDFPARYVNGYFLSGASTPAEAHHAWAEAWVDGLGWIGFDAANLICPTDRYVRLSVGLDALSAAPIRGTRRGGENETLDVKVEVQQQSSQQQ